MNEFIKYSYWTVVVASMLLIGILVVFSFHLHFDKCETVDRQSLTTLLQQEHNQRWGVMNDSAIKIQSWILCLAHGILFWSRKMTCWKANKKMQTKIFQYGCV